MRKKWIVFYYFILLAPILSAVALHRLQPRKMKFSDYLNYSFPPRQKLQSLNNYLQVDVLKGKNLGALHMGQEGWLFYLTRGDGDVLKDFIATPDEAVLMRWYDYVSKSQVRPYCLDAQYLFVSPPNKETVYSEKTNFPLNHLIPRKRALHSQLHSVLQKNFQNHVANVEPALREHKSESPTYFHSDSHWSNWGAYWAHREILEKANGLLKTSFVAKEVEMSDSTTQEPSDIRGMLTPLGYSWPSSQQNVLTLKAADPIEILEPDSSLKVFSNSQGQKIVWVIGDSFREGLEPYLPQYFSKTVFIYSSRDLDADFQRLIKTYGAPDLIVDVVVERYLRTKPAEYKICKD